MKLFLSSYYNLTAPERLTRLIGPNKRVGLTLNASDAYGDAKRPWYLERFSEDFKKLGLEVEELDLRHYFGKSEQLEERVSDFGLVWASGGNTFVLRRAMKLSGLDMILSRKIPQNQLVYGGFSAGACVASPTLKGIELADEPQKVPAGYPSEVIWEGLNLVNFYIAPHFRSPHPESEMMEGVVDYYLRHKLPYYALCDGEAVVVEDEKIEKVGHPSAAL